MVISGSRSGGDGRRRKDGGEGKRASQLGEGDPLVGKKSFDLNTLQCFGISRLSISRVEILEE
jgi:hypothetical protein